MHTTTKPHACPTCGLGFQRRNEMLRHERNHSGIKPYCCKRCGKGI